MPEKIHGREDGGNKVSLSTPLGSLSSEKFALEIESVAVG